MPDEVAIPDAEVVPAETPETTPPGVFVLRTEDAEGNAGVRLLPQNIDLFAVPTLLKLALKAAEAQIVG